MRRRPQSPARCGDPRPPAPRRLPPHVRGREPSCAETAQRGGAEQTSRPHEHHSADRAMSRVSSDVGNRPDLPPRACRKRALSRIKHASSRPVPQPMRDSVPALARTGDDPRRSPHRNTPNDHQALIAKEEKTTKQSLHSTLQESAPVRGAVTPNMAGSIRAVSDRGRRAALPRLRVVPRARPSISRP